MDQIKIQNLQTRSTDDPMMKKSQFLNKTLKFLLSLISIFSFTLSYSTSWFPAGVNGYLSLFSFHLLNYYTIERKYMFLLCNGILVFLARNFDLFSSSSTVDLQDRLDDVRNVDQFWSKPTDFSEVVVEKEMVVESFGSSKSVHEDGAEEVKEGQTEEKQEPVLENEMFMIEEEERMLVEGGEEEDEDQEEQEEEEDGSLSTEELNKKFEEFIKKMKEGIRIEAQQQLVFA